MIGTLIDTLIKTGAPWGILCAVLSLAVWVLWRRCNLLSDRLYDVSMLQTKKSTQVHERLYDLHNEVQEIRRRL